jgi:hypothetical protein
MRTLHTPPRWGPLFTGVPRVENSKICGGFLTGSRSSDRRQYSWSLLWDLGGTSSVTAGGFQISSRKKGSRLSWCWGDPNSYLRHRTQALCISSKDLTTQHLVYLTGRADWYIRSEIYFETRGVTSLITKNTLIQCDLPYCLHDATFAWMVNH